VHALVYGMHGACTVHAPRVYRACTVHACTRPAPWVRRAVHTRPAPWVRSAAGNYHRDVGAPPAAKLEAQGCRVEALGGGRITLDSKARCREM